MNPTIRLANTHDGTELARLRWDFSPDEVATAEMTFESFQERFTAFVEDALRSRWTVWVAESAGRLVGNMWVYLVEKVPRPAKGPENMGYLTNVYIEEGFRGQRVGERMLADIIHWAREHELELLLVWPSDESVSFYRRAGFMPSGQVPGAGESLMELHFSQPLSGGG